MLLEINSQKFKYDPQFSPSGQSIWRRKNDWHTIVPQKIGSYSCFIKCFESCPTGWPLVQKLVGHENTGSPKILATSVEELERDLNRYYLFNDFVAGFTLKRYLKKGYEIDVLKLVDHVWKSMETIHTSGFWHPDFCEENIYYSERDQSFYLIDIDSAELNSISPSPTKNEPGSLISQELAIISMWFIQRYVDPGVGGRFQNFSGFFLNQLQLISLITKLHYYALKLNNGVQTKCSQIAEHLQSSGDLAIKYISLAWQVQETRQVISLPIIKTIIKTHFPELCKKVVIQL